MNFFYFPLFQIQASPHSVGEMGTTEMPGEVGQSVGGSDGGEQAPPEHQEVQAEGSICIGGPSSIPAITVTHATEEAATVTETEEGMPPPQLAGTVTIVMISVVHEFRALEKLEKNFYMNGDTL
jgi:hypothetical protein